MATYLYEVLDRLIGFDTVSSKSNLAAVDYLAGELTNSHFNVKVQPIEISGTSQANLIAWAGPPFGGVAGPGSLFPWAAAPPPTRPGLGATRSLR